MPTKNTIRLLNSGIVAGIAAIIGILMTMISGFIIVNAERKKDTQLAVIKQKAKPYLITGIVLFVLGFVWMQVVDKKTKL